MNNQNINPKSLKGKDIFNRTLELMDKLTPINESVINASLEFVKKAPNGLVYTIIRENHKYFIKSINKSEFKISELNYIGGLQNKMMEAYSSYEEALKHLNMKFQQINETYGIKRGLNLFEQDAVDTEDVTNKETGTKEKKYKLKVSAVDKEKGSKSPMDSPSPEPSPSPSPAGTPETPSVEDVPNTEAGEEMGAAPEAGEEMGAAPEAGEEMGAAPEAGEESEEDSDDEFDMDDEEDPKKYIQKLTGRLGQKLRELSEVDPKLEKYVINSIISALHVDKMDKKDRMDVIKKFKKKKGMESMMKESFDLNEYYGMMSIDGPFNYEKFKGGFDENAISSHSKSHRPLRFKKYELNMDEKKEFPDLTGDGKVTFADILKGRGVNLKKKKKSSDEQWQGLAARAAGAALGSYLASRGSSDSDESLDHMMDEKTMDREARIDAAINRIERMERRKKSDDIEFHSTKDEKYDHGVDEIDVYDLYNSGDNEPDVMNPDTDTDTDIEDLPPVRRRQDPLDPGNPENDPMVRPKMGKKEKDLTFESIIKKYMSKK